MKQINIFYADDDEDDLEFFNEAIGKIASTSELHIALHIHKNGEGLIENIKTHKDGNGVVFLDINMPFKNGFELLEEIRKEPGIEQFPVVMYSTSSNKDYIDKSQLLGANRYVIKPFEFHSLLEMLETFISIDWNNYQPGDRNFLYK